MGKRVRLIYDLPIADRQSIYRLLVSSTYVVEDINCVGVYKNGRGEKILLPARPFTSTALSLGMYLLSTCDVHDTGQNNLQSFSYFFRKIESLFK